MQESNTGMISDLETAVKTLERTSNERNRLKTLQDSAINGSCFVCVKFCLALENEIVQSRAAQALCSIFIGESIFLHFSFSFHSSFDFILASDACSQATRL